MVNRQFPARIVLYAVLILSAAVPTVLANDQILGGNLGGGLRIKDITYNAPLELETQQTAPEDPYTIDHPPIVGFVPYITISLTDERLEDLEYNAEKEPYYTGASLTANPQEDFKIGIFDTGASSHVFGYESSQQLGLSGDYVTSNMMTIGGVSGFVDTYVSMPVGVFFGGLDSMDPNGANLDTSMLFGQSNTAVITGMQPAVDEPDLPTVIGCPMSVFYDVAINNDTRLEVTKNGEVYKSPLLSIYDFYDPLSPEYSNVIPLELRPLGAMSVTYTPSADGAYEFEFDPASPSVIVGTGSQSLYFVHAVDLENEGNLAFDKDRFMFDTGAQSTIIGSRVAARLGLDPEEPDFEIQAMGVNGEIVTLPGFVIDSLTIPALGNWLTFTNVPVAMLDVASPEGGTLDGIIGTNLFMNYNMVIRGGGMMLQDDPSIEFQPRQVPYIAGDIAPLNSPDGEIDINDFLLLASYWLMTPEDTYWDQQVDIAPSPLPDGVINWLDFSKMAQDF